MASKVYKGLWDPGRRWWTVENGAVKYPQGFSIEDKKKEWKTLGGYIAFYIVLRYNDCATQILYFHLASVHFYFGKNAGSVFVRLQRGNEFVSQQ